MYLGKVLTTETMHPLVKSVEYAVRGALPIRAEALSQVIEGEKREKRGKMNTEI